MNVFEESLKQHRTLNKIPVWIPGHCGLWYPPYREYLQYHGADKKYQPTQGLLNLIKATSTDLGLLYYDVVSHPLAAGRCLGMEPSCSKEGTIGFEKQIHSPSDIHRLEVQQALKTSSELTQLQLESMIGIIRHVGPFTMTGYLIEGEAKWQPRLRTLLFQYPTLARILLQKSTDAIIQWFLSQPSYQSFVLYIDEAWSTLIQPEDQDVFITPWLEYLISKLPHIPILLKASGSDRSLKRYYQAGLSAYIPDMFSNYHYIKEQTAYSMTIAAPFDAGRLLSAPAVIKQTIGRFLESVGPEDLLVTLNSEPIPHTSLAQIRAWIEAIHAYTLAY